MTTLHEIEPGVWIVPELVDRVEAQINRLQFTYHVTVSMLVGGEVQCRRGQVEVRIVQNGLGFRSYSAVDEDIDALAHEAAREVAAWIDERRTEPLTVVRA